MGAACMHRILAKAYSNPTGTIKNDNEYTQLACETIEMLVQVHFSEAQVIVDDIQLPQAVPGETANKEGWGQ